MSFIPTVTNLLTFYNNNYLKKLNVYLFINMLTFIKFSFSQH